MIQWTVIVKVANSLVKMSRGVVETEELQKNLEAQLERIMSQLEDIEAMKWVFKDFWPLFFVVPVCFPISFLSTVLSLTIFVFLLILKYPTLLIRIRDEMEPEEYAEQKEDTLEQLKDFQQHLSSLRSGNLSVVDSFGAMQLVSSVIQLQVLIVFASSETNDVEIGGRDLSVLVS